MNKCVNCNKEFEAKTKRALFCSDKCRAAFNRAKENLVEAAEQVEKDKAQLLVEQVEAERVESEDWKNSAEKKTQAEIEEHYSLKNFPSRPRYYSANGGGAGGFSPYLSSDPRSVAYSLK